jgi:hypothetical protein
MNPLQNQQNNNSAGAIKPEIDMDKYKDYKAYMDRRFEESKATDEYRAKFQARKDAKLAREAAAKREEEKPLKAEPSTAEQNLASVSGIPAPQIPAAQIRAPSPMNTQSDNEDPIDAWKPRQHRRDHSGNEAQNKNASTIPGRKPSLSAAAHLPASNAATSGPSPRRVPLGDIPENNGGFSRAVEPPPKSRRSSASSASESLHERRKRPAESALHDDRRASDRKHARKSSSAASPQPPDTETARPTGADRQPPDWYKALPKPNGSRGRDENASETAIQRLKNHIKKAKMSRDPTLYNDILEGLHKLVFLPVTDKLLRKTRIMDNNDGLPQLFDDYYSNIVKWPWYIKADAEELYNKWCKKIFETDLYRGLIRGVKGTGNTADRLAKEDGGNFRLMNPRQHGNGLLINGSWYPSQLAVLRDGGHGASQGGITASPTDGAYSVIMAGGMDPKGRPYPNIDNGDDVLYCGTDNTNPEVDAPSHDTKAMLVNHATEKPVRLFRSSNLNNKYAPELGFRYDGLYSVKGYEKMDPDGERRNRHRFQLVRCDGQDPIRSDGPAKRPTAQEVEEYEKDKKNRGR